MRKEHPQFDLAYKKFIRSIQKHDSKQPSIHKAIKYIGNKPIQPNKISIRHNNSWIPEDKYKDI